MHDGFWLYVRAGLEAQNFKFALHPARLKTLVSYSIYSVNCFIVLEIVSVVIINKKSKVKPIIRIQNFLSLTKVVLLEENRVERETANKIRIIPKAIIK